MDSAPQTPQPQAVSDVAPGAPQKRVSEEIVFIEEVDGVVSVVRKLCFLDNPEDELVDEQGQPLSGGGLDSE